MANIDIRPINILLDTNIPGKEVIPLKKSLLYQPELKNTGNWNDIPFFTMDAEYPEGYLSTLSYEKQMEFFFNKKVMNDTIRLKSGMIIKPLENTSIKTQSEQTQERKMENKTKEVEERVTSEKRTEIQKISNQSEKQIQNLEKDIQQKNLNLQIAILNELEGNVTYENGFKKDGKPLDIDGEIRTMEDYQKKRAKQLNIEKGELTRLLDEITNFTVIKKIFDISGNKIPTSDGPKEVTDVLTACDAGNIDYSERFFKNVPEDNSTIDGWDWGANYKKNLLESLNQYMSNPFFNTVSKDLKDIINTVEKIKLADLNVSKGGDGDAAPAFIPGIILTDQAKMATKQQNMCDLLQEIIKEFNGLKPQITNINKLNPISILDSKIAEYKKGEEKIKAEETKEKENINSQSEKQKQDFIETKPNISNKPTESEVTVEDETDIEKERAETGEKNIMIMIRLMFPTKYPIIGNVFSSFHSVVTGKNEFHLKWTDFIPNFLKKKMFEGMSDYSYIKVDGNVYTIIQAIWLNDIYNHKEYGKLINQFEELRKWKDKEAKQSKLDLMKKHELFRQTYDAKITETDIENIRKTKDNTSISEVSKNERTYGLVTTYNLNIDKLIKIMQNLRDSKDERTFFDNANKLVDSVKYLKSNQTFSNWFKPDNQTKLDKLIQGMSGDLNKIKIEEYILEKYLTRPGIQMDYTEEPREYRDVLDQKYKLYVNFIENIKKFRKPVLESSNNLLQDSINDFLNNTEKYRGVFNFLMNPINVKSNPFDELILKGDIGNELGLIKNEQALYQKRLNTGITIRPTAQGNDPYYEIYLQLNLIGGEINDKNKSTIDCMYQGESLGDKLARLLNETLYNPWTLNNTRVFFDITKGEAKAALDEKDKQDKTKEAEKKSKETNTEKSTEPSKKVGGKSTRKYRELFMKTRKHYW